MGSMHLSKDEFARLPTAPPDPIMLGSRGERPLNYNSATGRWLYKQSHMPLGVHAGKIMERVPGCYLKALCRCFDDRLAFVEEEPPVFFKDETQRKRWYPVISYCRRHWDWVVNMAETEEERAAQRPAEAPKPPQRSRNYDLRLPMTNIDLERCKTTLSPKYCCELCHDNEAEPCACPPATRTARNKARRRQ